MTKPGFRWTIGRQAFVLGLLPATLMFFCLVVFFTQSRLQEARLEHLGRAQMMADQLAPALEFDLITGNQTTLQTLLLQVSQAPMVYYVEVRDYYGNLVGRRFGPDVGPSPPPREPEGGLHRVRAEIRQASLPLESPFDLFEAPPLPQVPAVLGHVEIAVAEEFLASSQHDIMLRSLSVACLLFVFTWLLVRRMAAQLAGPVRGLTAKVDALTNGNYATPPVRAQAIEISRLSVKIDDLAARLQSSERQQQELLAVADEARQVAENASQAKSEFLALMNHELRTPVNGLLGMLQLLQATPLNDEQKGILSSATASGAHLDALLSDIMVFSRMRETAPVLAPQAVDIADLLNRLWENLRPAIETKGLSGRLDMDDALTAQHFLADPVRLRQIAANLLDNAIKFTATGSISLAARLTRSAKEPAASSLRLTVKDTGKGIATEFLPELFRPFRQEETGDARSHGGSGLGLAIVDRLVAAMRGHIEVASRRGEGCTFTVTLPLEPAASQRRDAGCRPLHVLVVEDNPVNMKVTCGLLRHLGHTSTQAFNGMEALNSYESDSYDVILMDCQMPIMDGFEATREIRRREGARHAKSTPIIALTANAEENLKRRCLEAGMDDCLTKPVQRLTLQDRLERIVDAEGRASAAV